MSASAPSSTSAGVSTAGPSETGAAPKRRVPPRHFHAERNPPAASDSDAAQADADEPPPVTRLLRHALESVFAFLDKGELVAALQVSPSWLSAVRSLRSQQLEVKPPNAPLCVVVESAMGRHVTAIGTTDEPVTLSPDSLYVVALKMPQLFKLACELALPPLQAPLTFPAALRVVVLSVCDPAVDADINAAIKAISRLSLLESCTIQLPSFSSGISFAPLAALPQLRDLFLDASDPDADTLSDAQVDELRAMSRLRRLDVQPTPTSLLRRLLAPPQQLQWQQISLPDPLSDEAAALLPQLPSLTDIETSLSCDRFAWLRGLPNLTCVCLTFNEPVGAAGRADSLVAGLQCCTNIRTLVFINGSDLTTENLAAVLPSLPQLQKLYLDRLLIDSLSFLAQPPMTDQLIKLSLEDCAQLPQAELRHVHSLRGLKTLRLLRSFSTPMDEHGQLFYWPPSIALPQLEEFEYSAPGVDVED